MIAKCACQHCGNPIEFEAEHNGMGTECPHCGQRTVLQASPKRTVTADVKPAASVKTIRNPVKEHLATIRANSCYPTLRGLINVCVWVLVACGYIAPLVSVSLTQAQLTAGMPHYNMYGPLFAGLVAAGVLGTICLVILIAVRQLSMLLIDIADTLLHEHAKGN